MRERKKKRRSPFDIFGFDEDFSSFGDQLPSIKGKGGSGYSVSITYDEKGKPAVKVETYGDVDVAKLRQDIEQRYPSARIEGLEKKPLIRIIDEETTEKPQPEKKTEEKSPKHEKKQKKGSFIRIVE